MRIGIQDGDYIIHTVSNLALKAIKLDSGITTIHCHRDEVIEKFNLLMDKINSYINCDRHIFCFSDSKNFRTLIYPEYKDNREYKEIFHIVKKQLKDYIVNNYTSCQKPYLEADDIQGIVAGYHQSREDREVIIVSIDKDLRTIKGKHFNPDKPELGIESVNYYEADLNLWTQVLAGDKADGYKGCWQYGDKSANEFLKKHFKFLGFDEEMHNLVKKEFIEKGHSEEYFYQMARCARILRYEDYDYEQSKIKLWLNEYENTEEQA